MDNEFADKLAGKHGVTKQEAEEVLNSKPHVRKKSRGNVKNENVYGAYGQTDGGRYLVIFYIRKLSGTLLPISGRDMDRGERDYYDRQKESD